MWWGWGPGWPDRLARRNPAPRNLGGISPESRRGPVGVPSGAGRSPIRAAPGQLGEPPKDVRGSTGGDGGGACGGRGDDGCRGCAGGAAGAGAGGAYG